MMKIADHFIINGAKLESQAQLRPTHTESDGSATDKVEDLGDLTA